MKFKVESYTGEEHPRFCHICRDEENRTCHIDLFVNGDLTGIDPKSLVGKTVEVERLHPYLQIAHGVKIISGVENDTSRTG